MNILGVHIGHDAGAALVADGVLVASVNEERFTRIKHYAYLPIESVRHCLRTAGITMEQVDEIACSSPVEEPGFAMLFGLEERDLRRVESGVFRRARAPRAFARRLLKRFLPREQPPRYIELFHASPRTRLLRVDHHLAHAASAYYTSGFREPTTVVTCDGIGDGVSLAVWSGENGSLARRAAFGREGSLGWFYGAVTEALDWWVGDGEGKTMGLAPYGRPDAFPDAELEPFLPRYSDGRLEQGHDFGAVCGFKLQDTMHWHLPDSVPLAGIVRRRGREDTAAKAQSLLERSLLNFVSAWVRRLGARCLATSGGVFLNVKLNQRIVESRVAEQYHVFPNAGDGGQSDGAALWAYFRRTKAPLPPVIRHLYLGPEYPAPEIRALLDERRLDYRVPDDLTGEVARDLAAGRIVGWFQGRMECGPRALGGRSILVDPGRGENKDILNARVKFREPFRPFCPSLPIESAGEFFRETRPERFMITSIAARPEAAGRIPAVVHVDGTCRPQFVERDVNPLFWELLRKFGERSGTPVLLNTSFNIRGEPMVCTPRDAIKCFFDTGLDALALGPYYLVKTGRPGR